MCPDASSPSNKKQYRTTLSPVGSLDVLETRWRELESDSDCEFFLSWSWIGPWLELIGERSDLQLFQCYQGNLLVALALVGIAPEKKRRLYTSRIVTINQLLDGFDMCQEYNGLLARKGHEADGMQTFIDCLRGLHSDWDEIRLTNASASTVETIARMTPWLREVDQEQHNVWIADLTDISDTESVLNKLNKKRRYQIRRSLKLYEDEGEVRIDCASTEAQAQDYFMRMGVLHTERWQRAGQSGSFANPVWVRFHQAIIKNAFDRGEIQLLRIHCGERDIGYLYNFVWRNSVLISQSGFATETHNLFMPGYTSHVLAMSFNARAGRTHYNFLMGDSKYKHVLGEKSSALVTLRLQQPRLKFELENQLLKAYRTVRRIIMGAGPSAQVAILLWA